MHNKSGLLAAISNEIFFTFYPFSNSSYSSASIPKAKVRSSNYYSFNSFPNNLKKWSLVDDILGIN